MPSRFPLPQTSRKEMEQELSTRFPRMEKPADYAAKEGPGLHEWLRVFIERVEDDLDNGDPVRFDKEDLKNLRDVEMLVEAQAEVITAQNRVARMQREERKGQVA